MPDRKKIHIMPIFTNDISFEKTMLKILGMNKPKFKNFNIKYKNSG
jgi:hypothetical protein